jgi:hypothetical protein
VDDVLAPGASVGMDFAGDIVAIGAGVDGFSIGDAVAGFVRGGFDDPDNAAFQEYVRADPALVCPISPIIAEVRLLIGVSCRSGTSQRKSSKRIQRPLRPLRRTSLMSKLLPWVVSFFPRLSR